MQAYYGAKLIHAEPANKGVDEGYFVKYEDGYTSWSPKEVFEKAYRPVEGLPFGLALEAMKQGKKMYRASWPKDSKYLTYHPPGVYSFSCINETHANGQVFMYLAPQIDLLASDWKVLE